MISSNGTHYRNALVGSGELFLGQIMNFTGVHRATGIGRLSGNFTAYKKEIDLGEIVLSGSIPWPILIRPKSAKSSLEPHGVLKPVCRRPRWRDRTGTPSRP